MNVELLGYPIEKRLNYQDARRPCYPPPGGGGSLLTEEDIVRSENFVS